MKRIWENESLNRLGDRLRNLTDRVQALRTENEKLRQENLRLSVENGILEEENETLRKQKNITDESVEEMDMTEICQMVEMLELIANSLRRTLDVNALD